jgi:hypothetical protein
MRRAADGVGIADAVRTHVYRKWPTKESRKCWAVRQRAAAWQAWGYMLIAAMEFDPVPSQAYNASHHGLDSSRCIAC